jgi:non-specific serine/threonine protein kinase
LEIGEIDRWPYAAYAHAHTLTLRERAAGGGLAPQDVARASAQVLDGLAFAHDAGLAHRDIQPAMILLSESAGACLIGLEMARPAAERAAVDGESAGGTHRLQTHRREAERDVLAFGLVLHFALTGQHALGRDDTSSVIALMPPQGREIVRLPWSTGRPIPEPLRVIANRSTDRQQRQRYHNARTFARALEGWYRADAQADGGPLALLLDRLRQIGPLPSMPGSSRRAARLALMERERTNELAEIVMQDPALTFELLRLVNTAQVRGAMVSGSGPVLTVRRAISLLGMDGVRRAALGLRDWPGPLAEAQATQLEAAIARAQHAARIAQLLRPAGFDAEVIYLVALLQNLGRLLVHYHFPEEAVQLLRLMHPSPAEEPGKPDEPGMSEEAASFAVLGVDIDVLAYTVAKHWGFDDTVLHMIRRCSAAAPIHTAENDDDALRVTASCANEVVDALALDARRAAAGLHRVAQRYARALGLTERDLQLAAQGQVPDAGEGASGALVARHAA